MLSVSMPKSRTPSAFVETATKCFATADASPPSPSRHHARAACALARVSSVVKVLEQTMNSVCAGSSPRTASLKSVPSSLDTKPRSEEHTYELQSLMRISYAVFCLKNKKKKQH